MAENVEVTSVTYFFFQLQKTFVAYLSSNFKFNDFLERNCLDEIISIVINVGTDDVIIAVQREHALGNGRASRRRRGSGRGCCCFQGRNRRRMQRLAGTLTQRLLNDNSCCSHSAHRHRCDVTNQSRDYQTHCPVNQSSSCFTRHPITNQPQEESLNQLLTERTESTERGVKLEGNRRAESLRHN